MKGITQKVLIFVSIQFAVNMILANKFSMSPDALKALDIMFLAIFLWVTEIVHPTITALIIFCLIPSWGVLSPDEAFVVMGDTIIWRLVGIFIITIGMEKTGLARRVALGTLSLARGNLHYLLMLMEILTFLFVFLVPVAAARTAILSAICMGLVMKMEDGQYKNLAKASSLIIPMVSLVSGSSIIVGASVTIYAAGFFEKNLGNQWSYLSWMIANLPINILAMIAIYLTVIFIFPFESHISGNVLQLEEEKRRLGKLSEKELKMLGVIIFLFCAWFFNMTKWMPAELFAATVLMLPGINVLDRKETFKNLEWGTVILFGSGLAMAEGLNKTQAIDVLVNQIPHNFLVNELAIAVAIMLITVLVRLGMANMTGVGATLLPIFTSLSRALGINPQWSGMICVLACGLGILLPSQSSSLLATYVYGYYNPKDLFKAGSIISVIYILIVAVIAKFYWPIIGIPFKL